MVFGVRLLGIKMDEDSSPVRATPKTIQDGSYPMSHYLYLYTAGPATGIVRDFMLFTLSADGQSIVRACEESLVSLPMVTAGD